MWNASASVRDVGGAGDVGRLVRELEEEWQTGRPDLSRFWRDLGPDRSVNDLATLVKADLRFRFARGERPEVAEYLERFPELGRHDDRMLSLIYEEFCLCEEQGDTPAVDQFCERYERWKDSLASQLRYHALLSQVVGAPPPPIFPKLGDHFQEFSLRAELGRGGSARVYLANDESLGGREVALKVYADRGTEAKILGRLEHPHIVPVHSTPYQPETKLRGLCMPYQPGVPLDVVIGHVKPSSRPKSALALWDALLVSASEGVSAPTTPLPERPDGPGWKLFPARGLYADGVAWLVARLAEALEHAHQRSVEHRDVKPANVLLTFRDGPQLLDFNLAHDQHSPIQAEAALRGGTLPYMAPEQLDAFLDPTRWDDVDGRADLYSLGLVLRELLTGDAPELPDTALPVPRAIAEMLDRRAGLRPGLRQANPRVPHALESIAARCLAFSPADRYHSASELADDLRRYLARRPLRYATNPSKAEKAANLVSRYRLAIVVSLAMIAGTAALRADYLRRPVEKSANFLSAVGMIDDDDARGASQLLKRLEGGTPNSPLVEFYQAVVCLENRDLEEVDKRLGRLWTVPGAESTLVSWAKTHPMLAKQANRLGQSELKSIKDEPSRVGEYFNTTYRTLSLALKLNPDDSESRLGLATLAESQGNYRLANQLVTEAIDRLSAQSLNTKGDLLRRCYQNRARLRITWSESLLKDRAGEKRVSESHEHLTDAVADLNLAALQPSYADPVVAYDVKFILTHAQVGLGEVALRRHHLEEAVAALTSAQRLLCEIESQRGGEERKRLASLSARLNELMKQARSPRDVPTDPDRLTARR